MKKTKLESEKLWNKSLNELNSFIKKSAKILNDRERYLEILAGRRTESGKRMANKIKVRSLEIEDALYSMSAQAQEVNAGRKTISKGKSVRFSGAKSSTIKQALNRAIKMQNLLRSKRTTAEGLQKLYISKLKGLSKEFWGDEDYTRLSFEEWDEISKFWEVGEKHGVPSEITYKFAVQPYERGDPTFDFASQYDKWLYKHGKIGSKITLVQDLLYYVEKVKEFRNMTKAEKQMYGLNDIDDVIDRFWQNFEEF